MKGRVVIPRRTTKDGSTWATPHGSDDLRNTSDRRHIIERYWRKALKVLKAEKKEGKE